MTDNITASRFRTRKNLFSIIIPTLRGLKNLHLEITLSKSCRTKINKNNMNLCLTGIFTLIAFSAQSSLPSRREEMREGKKNFVVIC
jgi:hypothetical protein